MPSDHKRAPPSMEMITPLVDTARERYKRNLATKPQTVQHWTDKATALRNDGRKCWKDSGEKDKAYLFLSKASIICFTILPTHPKTSQCTKEWWNHVYEFGNAILRSLNKIEAEIRAEREAYEEEQRRLDPAKCSQSHKDSPSSETPDSTVVPSGEPQTDRKWSPTELLQIQELVQAVVSRPASPAPESPDHDAPTLGFPREEGESGLAPPSYEDVINDDDGGEAYHIQVVSEPQSGSGSFDDATPGPVALSGPIDGKGETKKGLEEKTQDERLKLGDGKGEPSDLKPEKSSNGMRRTNSMERLQQFRAVEDVLDQAYARLAALREDGVRQMPETIVERLRLFKTFF